MASGAQTPLALPSPGRRLRDRIAAETIAVPGAFNAAVARLAERVGFAAVYVSGAGLASGLAALPDVGLLTLTEVAAQTRYIADAVSVPVIVDADTGFGEVLNVRRAVQELEGAGAAALQIEDQEGPKRCGHLAGKRVIPAEEMARKVAAAAEARADSDFVVIARVDSAAVDGLEDAIARGRLYRKAGADVVFPEGLRSREEFARYAEAGPGPLLANMTEFGVSPLLSVAELADLGYRIVLFPMTAFRVMMKAALGTLEELKRAGTQRGLLAAMQTREELYDLLGYSDYADLDQRLAGFQVWLQPEGDRENPS